MSNLQGVSHSNLNSLPSSPPPPYNSGESSIIPLVQASLSNQVIDKPIRQKVEKINISTININDYSVVSKLAKIILIIIPIIGWIVLGLIDESRRADLHRAKQEIDDPLSFRYTVLNRIQQLHQSFPKETNITYISARLHEVRGQLVESYHIYQKVIDSINASKASDQELDRKLQFLREQKEIAYSIAEKQDLSTDELLILLKYDEFKKDQPRLSAMCAKEFMKAFIVQDQRKQILWSSLGSNEYHSDGRFLKATSLSDEGNRFGEEAFKLLTTCAQESNAYALYVQGDCYFYAKEYKNAVNAYEASARQGNPYGLYGLGFCYQHGRGVDKDSSIAKYFYEEALKIDPDLIEAKKGLIHLFIFK